MPPRPWLVTIAAALIAAGTGLLAVEERPHLAWVGIVLGVLLLGIWIGKGD